MKKTDAFMKAIVGVLCGVVALYLVFSILQGADASYTTYKAVRYEVGDGLSTSGFVVREEQVLTSPKTIVVLTCGEGQRVAVGGTVASSYADESARHRQTQIDAMEEELAQMQYAYDYSGSESNSATLDNEIVQTVQTINTFVARQELGAAQSNAEQLKSLVLRRYITSADAETLYQRILKTEAELNALRSQSQTVSTEITVDRAGYFSGTVDGFESLLTPTFVEEASVGEVEEMFRRQPGKPAGAIGRLATNPRWYYVTVVETEALSDCEVGDYVSVQFAYDFYDSLQMRVSRISRDEDGKCVLVLTTDRYMQTAVSGRQQSAEIVFSSKSGLRVPKSAIYVDENGVSGVYILSGARAVWKPVELLFDSGEYFLVREDKSTTTNLWPDDEIILTTEEIYNGKVMQP